MPKISVTRKLLQLVCDVKVYTQSLLLLSKECRDFPGGTMVKTPPANAGDTGLNPDLGTSHMPQSN